MQKSDQLPATGVIGSAKITQNIVENENSVHWKITLILLLIALINIALFVLNLLPIPPLDGGHIALALIDGSRKGLAKIRKKVTPPDLDTARTLPFAYGVALTFALLSIYIAIQDISKYT
jgi:membrane-associated protease RseP (regulator of RpoE activity)